MPEFLVVANASSIRPWQVLGLLDGAFYVHGSFKTRRAALVKAQELNGGEKVDVVDSLETVHRKIYEPATLLDQRRNRR